MSTQSAKNQIEMRVNEVLKHAQQKYPWMVKVNHVGLSFIQFGYVAGRAIYHKGEYHLEFSLEALNKFPQEVLTNTVPHEVAHLVIYAYMRSGQWSGARLRPHGKEWKAICRELGGNGKTCHTMPLTPARRVSKPYTYQLPSGIAIHLTACKHKRIQHENVIYRYRPTGELILHNYYQCDTIQA